MKGLFFLIFNGSAATVDVSISRQAPKLCTDLTILSTNRLDEVDVGIQSRCVPLHVPPCTPKIFLPYAKKILDSVSVEYDDDALLDGLNTVYKISQDNKKYYQWLDRVIR